MKCFQPSWGQLLSVALFPLLSKSLLRQLHAHISQLNISCALLLFELISINPTLQKLCQGF